MGKESIKGQEESREFAWESWRDGCEERSRMPLVSGMNRRSFEAATIEAASILEMEGISVEVTAPSTVKPLDTDPIPTSVKKTGRLLVADGGRDDFRFMA